MILDALHIIINPIVQACPLIGDIEATVPFCVFKVEPEPIRTKDGIVGYQQKVMVVIIDDSNNLDRLDNNTIAVRAAIEGMSGTIAGTTGISVLFSSESGAIFDQETNSYQNSLEFNFDTDNR